MQDPARPTAKLSPPPLHLVNSRHQAQVRSAAARVESKTSRGLDQKVPGIRLREIHAAAEARNCGVRNDDRAVPDTGYRVVLRCSTPLPEH